MEESVDSHHGVHEDAGKSSWHPALRPQRHSLLQASFDHDAHQEDIMESIGEEQLVAENLIPRSIRNISYNHNFPSQQPRSTNTEGQSHNLGLDTMEHEDVTPKNIVHPEESVMLEQELHDEALVDALHQDTITASSERTLAGNMVVPSDGFTKEPILTLTNESGSPTSENPKSIHSEEKFIAAPVDPAWGFDAKTIGQDMSPQFSRTTSFPEVPTLHAPDELSRIQPLPPSQAESILDTIQQSTPLDTDVGMAFDPMLEENVTEGDLFGTATVQDEDSFFANINGLGNQDVSSPADEESRFEEGLPLVQYEINNKDEDHILAGWPNGEQISTFDPFVQGDDSNQDFLEQVPATTSTNDFFRPLALDRKSTNQVLDSIQYPPRHNVHVDRTNHQKTSTPRTVNDSRILDPAKPFNPPAMDDDLLHEGSTKTENQLDSTDNQEQDIAAMWQAALADDDFLEDDSMDPSAFFREDGDGFLNDGEIQQDQSLPGQFSSYLTQSTGSSELQQRELNQISTTKELSVSNADPVQAKYMPLQQQTATSAYIPEQQTMYSHKSTLESNSIPSTLASTRSIEQTTNMAFSSAQRPGMPEHTRSFANQSKSGYASPYDLPMDLTRPKKRTNLHPMQNNNRETLNLPQPPPRGSSSQSVIQSSSSLAQVSSSLINPPRPSLPPTAFSPIAPPTNLVAPALKAKPNTGSFFEELPIASKPRPQTKTIRPANSFSPTTLSPPQIPSERGESNTLQSSQKASSLPLSSSPAYQLLPPERVSPYANTAASSSTHQTVPVLNSRYSPAPPQQPSTHNSRNRYATAPAGPARPPSVSQILPFQPRTSSPLARSASATQQHQQNSNSTNDIQPPDCFAFGARRPSLRPFHTERPVVPEIYSSQIANVNPPSLSRHPTESIPTDFDLSQRSAQYHHPLEQSQILSPDHRSFNPPRRSQTQSPTSVLPASNNYDLDASKIQRSSSTDNVNLSVTTNPLLTVQPAISSYPVRAEPKVPSNTNYIVPSDGREFDLLERWKGCPIFCFGLGGTTVTSFPKQVPRYSAGQKIPLIKCSPGEVTIRTSKIIPLEERFASFPGPLKSKSKKKEVLEWLKKGISQLTGQYVSTSPDETIEETRKRHEEKIILWKIVHALVEYDGTIESKPGAEAAMRGILSPEVTVGASLGQMSYDTNLPLKSITKSKSQNKTSTSEDSEALEGLRRLLLQGEREKAVWHAVDQRFWGHAMLISSTLSRDVWKQVIQEFVRHEVKAFGENTESIAALYDIFAGNWEEAIDELVPPSARAGLQMVSKVAGPASTKNALDGLDRWRETLSLVLNNRSPDDEKALLVLGQLLSRYGRIEAAHVCYIFARSQASFGGSDDAQASLVLLGADHLHQPLDYSRDLDSVLLTEVYEFALTVLAPATTSATLPYLQAYKLSHAMYLAEHGYRDEAQQYCDAIQNNLKATTKMSPYYHTLLFGALDDLSSRLRQVPKDASKSWITRPSIDKMSGSVWSRFNHFVSGDNSDAVSTGSVWTGETETGPFAKASSESPTISRAESPSNLYGPFMNGDTYTSGPPTANTTNPQYAPAGLYTPRSTLDQPRQLGHPAQEPQRSGPIDSLKRTNIPRQLSYNSLPSYSPDLYNKSLFDASQQVSRPATATYPPNVSKYSPTPQTDFDPVRDSHIQDSPYSSYPSNAHELSLPTSPPYSQSPILPDVHIPSNAQKPLPATPNDSSKDSREQSSAGYEPSPNSISEQHTYEPRDLNPISRDPSPSAEHSLSTSYQPPSATFDNSSISYGYEPPNTSYDPPSYDPESNDGDISPVERRPKKSAIDDDMDDGFEARAAALKRKEKAERDREVDEAFRRAAEADEKSEKTGKPTNATKGSWFGWLGGGGKSKDPSPSQPRVIKAQLGEANSFQYDPVLKKWVNKKDGGTTTITSTATPPPPKGPPSRSVSATGKPAGLSPVMNGGLRERASMGNLSISNLSSSNLPSRNPSPIPPSSLSPTLVAEAPTTLSPPTLEDGPSSRPPSSGPPSAPPSRPATSTGTPGGGTASIDDLIGAPAARKGGTVKKGKKGRGYVDVLGKGPE